MKQLFFIFWFIPSLIFAQSPNEQLPLTEDRIKVLVNNQLQNIEPRILK